MIFKTTFFDDGQPIFQSSKKAAQAQAAAAAMARLENKKKTPMSATERKARQQLQNDQKLSSDMASEAEVKFFGCFRQNSKLETQIKSTVVSLGCKVNARFLLSR